jgi:hypothetical protein
MGLLDTLGRLFGKRSVATAPLSPMAALAAITRPETRLRLQQALIRSKQKALPQRSPLRRRHRNARAYGWPAVRASVPASVLRRDAFFSDPWWSRADAKKTEPEPAGDRDRAPRPDGSLVLSERIYELTLLDNRTAQHVRRVLKAPNGRRFKEFVMRTGDGVPTSLAQLSSVLPLYGLDRFDPADHDEIILAEGVAAASALIGMGFAAAGTLTGALHTPPPDALRPLTRFRHIYLWPDNDSIGVRHMERVAQRLHSYGAGNIKVIRWQGGPRKGDAADFQEGEPGVRDLMAKARTWKPGSVLRLRGQLAINVPRIPVTLSLPPGARSPDQPLEPERTSRARRAATPKTRGTDDAL